MVRVHHIWQSPQRCGPFAICHTRISFLVKWYFKFNLPIAHYFIGKLSGKDKIILLLSIIKVLTDSGVKVLTSTIDGASTNIVKTKILGCSFDFDNFNPQFVNPSDKSLIHIFLDTPHMLKLIRGTFGIYKQFHDRNGRVIQWNHFEKLVEF